MQGTTLTAVGYNILVQIDKEAQKAKKSKVGNILIPEQFTYMEYNLQYGTIVSIGDKAATVFPEAEIGDLAIFHHTIESDKVPVLDKLENGDEIKPVLVTDKLRDRSLGNKLYGIIKEGGLFIAHYDWVFLSARTESVKKKFVSELLILEDSKVWETDSKMQDRMNSLKLDIDNMMSTIQYEQDYRRKEEIEREVNIKQRECDRITAFISSEKMVKTDLMFVHPKVSQETGMERGQKVVVTHADGLIPLALNGQLYYMALTEFVVGILR